MKLFRILASGEWEDVLSRIDHDFAEEARSSGCLYCGSTLHSARYRRKPRCQQELGPGSSWRLSFCCSREGCRRRRTPPSVRFLSRRVYPMITVLLAMALTQGVTGSRFRKIASILGIDKRTLGRWRQWWLEAFPATRTWKELRARYLLSPADELNLPSILLSRVANLREEGVLILLKALSPLSVGAVHAR